MQILGFNFTKISAEKFPDFKGKANAGINIDFSNVKKEKLDLIKDLETYKSDFKLNISYSDIETKDKKTNSKLGEIIFGGNILIGISKEDPKEVAKAFRSNEIPIKIKEFFLNFILTKCATKALDLEDQLHLPLHIPFPQVKLQEKKE
jgi:hypothetical protein